MEPAQAEDSPMPEAGAVDLATGGQPASTETEAAGGEQGEATAQSPSMQRPLALPGSLAASPAPRFAATAATVSFEEGVMCGHSDNRCSITITL